MSVLVKISEQTTNAHPTHARRHAPDKYFMSYAHILHIFNLVYIETLSRTLNTFVTCSYTCQDIRDTIL